MVSIGLLYLGASYRYFMQSGWKLGIITLCYGISAIVFALLKIQ